METGIEWAVQAVTPGTVAPPPSDGAAAPVAAPRGAPDAAASVARLAGRLGAGAVPDVVAGLAGMLAQHPRLVLDVSGLAIEHAGAVPAFTEALDRVGGWPDVQFVLAAPDPALRELLRRVERRVPVYADVPTATARVGRRPEMVRAWWNFAVDEHAPGTARAYVRQVCGQWEVGADAREAAEIVVTELVTNAVEHAESPSTVEVERAAGSFTVWVRDFDTSPLPEVSLPSPTAPRGRGLAMVAAVAREWGVFVHPDGKSVWAKMAA